MESNRKLKKANLILGSGCVMFLIGVVGILFAGMSYLQDKKANQSNDIVQGTEIALFKQIVTLQSNTDTTGPAATANAQTIERLLKTQVALEENRVDSLNPNEPSIVNPTSTQEPIVIEPPAPFYDSFDLRPSEEWEYITGDWRVVDGMFTGTGSTDWISAQLTNPNWTNYTIDTNIFRKTFTEGFCILVRKNPDGHLAFCSHGQFCYWALSKDGNEQQIAYLSGSKFERLKGTFNVTIEVDDDIFTAYINKEKILQVQDTNFSSGRIGIDIDPGNFIIGIEDFRVTPK